MATKKLEVKMQFYKSTKGTHVYAWREGSQVIGTIYLTRAPLPDKPPPAITVTVEYDEDT